jgi:hypothetical protein
LLEALGLYWRSRNRTGEISGTQGQKLSGSKLCRERKRLATELIAAIANVRVFGTDPTFCNFPATLIDDARAAAAGDRIEAIQNASSLLRQFNSSGTTNDFPAGLFECAAPDKNSLKSESRDPTLQSTCPGVNDSCTAAEALYFKQGKAGILSQAKLSRRAVITSFADDIRSPTCAQGGADVVWKLTPDVAKAARHFTLDTFGSNFDTLLSVHQGSCSALTEVTCSDDSEDSLQSKVAFTADGTNTYFVVVEGKNGSVGKVKLKVTSP